MVDFNCPQCGYQMQVKDEHAGRTGKCKNCGEMVRVPSLRQKSLPPQPKAKLPPRAKAKRNLNILIVVFFGIFAVGGVSIVLCCSGITRQAAEDRRKEAAARAAEIQRRNNDPEYQALQQERREFIAKLVAEGFIQKTQHTGLLPHVWVTPKFLVGSFDAKQHVLSAVWAYFGEENILVIRSSVTNERIGTFSRFGLDLD